VVLRAARRQKISNIRDGRKFIQNHFLVGLPCMNCSIHCRQFKFQQKKRKEDLIKIRCMYAYKLIAHPACHGVSTRKSINRLATSRGAIRKETRLYRWTHGRGEIKLPRGKKAMHIFNCNFLYKIRITHTM
jgi:hypothetical protein